MCIATMSYLFLLVAALSSEVLCGIIALRQLIYCETVISSESLMCLVFFFLFMNLILIPVRN